VDQAQGNVKDRSECPSPNRKRASTSLVESKATASSRSAEEDGGCHDEEDPKLSPVTSGARIGSSADQEVVQEQAPTLGEIPCGWKRIKVEPDC
jgi:hypothetical protein